MDRIAEIGLQLEKYDEEARDRAGVAELGLRRENTIRTIAERVRCGGDIGRDDVRTLLAMSRTQDESRWRERTLALWALGEIELVSDELAEVVPAIERVVSNRAISSRVVRRAGRAALRTMAVAAISAVPLLILFTQGEYYIPTSPIARLLQSLFTVGACVTILSPLISASADRRANEHARWMGVWALGRRGTLASVPIVGTFVSREVVRAFIGKDRSDVAKCGVKRLLRRQDWSKVEIDARLSDVLTRTLCAMLRESHYEIDNDLVAALSRVGNERALLSLQDIADDLEDDEVVVRDFVEEAIAAIRARADRANERAELLRASETESALPETLLRAANVASVTPPELLLRSGAGSESNDR